MHEEAALYSKSSASGEGAGVGPKGQPSHLAVWSLLVVVTRQSPAPSEHECGCCGDDDDEGLGDGGQLLVITHEAAVLDDPGEGPLDDPASRQDLKPLRGGVSAYDLQGDVRLLPGPVDQAPGIATICKGVLYEGVSGPGALQHPFGPVAILDVGAMDMDGEPSPVGVGQDVALATPDLLACIVAPGAPF